MVVVQRYIRRWYANCCQTKSWRKCRGLALLETAGVLTAVLLFVPPVVSIGMAALHQQRLEAAVEQLVHPSALGNLLVRRSGSFELEADSAKMMLLCQALIDAACKYAGRSERGSCIARHGALVAFGSTSHACGGKKIARLQSQSRRASIGAGRAVEALEVYLQGLPESIVATGWWESLTQSSDLAGVQRLVPVRGEVVWDL